MFDDVLGTAMLCVENFRGGVHDSFGASIIADVLDPVLNEIVLLRSFNKEFQGLSLDIDRVLQEARSFHLNEASI
jgi:hypothetical protein